MRNAKKWIVLFESQKRSSLLEKGMQSDGYLRERIAELPRIVLRYGGLSYFRRRGYYIRFASPKEKHRETIPKIIKTVLNSRR
jgi:hypothetical protein